MKKSHIIAASIATVAVAGVVGIGAVSAATTTSPKDSLIDKLVSTFHLNKADVQKVFDQQKTENQANRAADEKTRLDQAVTDGKITSAQESLIIAKQAEIKTFLDSQKDKSEANRRTAMKTEMDSIKQWAKDNNIPERFVNIRMGGQGRRGMDPGAAAPTN